MFTLNEIETENQSDFFPRLFIFLARSIFSTCGHGGEGAVRESVRQFGAERGLLLRDKHIDAGIKTNVKSFYCVSDSACDFRMRSNMLRLNEEVCLREIYTCPYADLWGHYNACDIGLWFCEEYERSMFLAYTSGKGQAHLSARLTCPRENHCRFSMYYRKANVDPVIIERCFSYNITEDARTSEYDDRFHLTIGESCARLYFSILDVTQKRFGNEGECAVANGLRELAAEEARVLQRQARHTLNRCDEEYVIRNFPISLCATDESFLTNCKNDAAIHLLQINLLDPLKKLLGLSSCGTEVRG